MDDFIKALPKYPNDGVLLIDVQKFNRLHILPVLEEIAMSNSRGEYVVNLGTQQFTVLGLHDKWKELPPRGNLRHSPDVARGFLMWFFYNGFIHYAGIHKPRSLCVNLNPYSFMRAVSYTAWAISNYQVSQKCPHDEEVYAKECVSHIYRAKTIKDFIHLLSKVTTISKDTSPLYVRIGPLQGNLSYSNLQIPESGVFEAVDIVETLDRIGTLGVYHMNWL